MVGTTSSSNLKPPNRNGRFAWSGGPPMNQFLNLPSGIIYHIIKSTQKKAYLKLAKTCKYFFEKFPFLIVERIHDDGKKFCSNDMFECKRKNRKCCVSIDLAKITTIKIWLIRLLEVRQNNISNIATEIVPKLFGLEETILHLNHTEITMNDFKIFAKKFYHFYLDKVTLTNEKEGSVVMLETILESILNLQSFIYDPPDTLTYNVSTMKNIAKLHNLSRRCYFILVNIPEDLNLVELAAFIKDNKEMHFDLKFSASISDKYKMKLGALVDTLIAAEVPNRCIKYDGQDKQKRKILKSRFDNKA